MKHIEHAALNRLQETAAPVEEYQVQVTVRGPDALRAVMTVLNSMAYDCAVGHGSVYVCDAEGDRRKETYIDGDGGDGVSDPQYALLVDGEPKDFQPFEE